MRIRSVYALLILFIGISQTTFAQTPKSKSKDFFNIKAPAIEYSVPDTSEVLFEEEFTDSSDAFESIYFDPSKDLSIVSEDTSTNDEGELSVVEVSEELKMDCVWVTIAEYYAIWDSRSVNPYKIDGSKFNDTLPIILYDTLAGKGWSMPIPVTIPTSNFGMRNVRWHYGIDLKLQIGDPVVACFDGIVRISHYDPGGYGNYVLVRHYNGVETLYGHLTNSEVSIGQLVKAGELIGIGGNTGRSSGPHLHFEVRYEGNAIDPESIYDFENNTIWGRTFELMPIHFTYLKESRKVVYHKVRPGDNLGIVSKKYRVSIQEICRLNKITTRSVLKVGRKLRIR